MVRVVLDRSDTEVECLGYPLRLRMDSTENFTVVLTRDFRNSQWTVNNISKPTDTLLEDAVPL